MEVNDEHRGAYSLDLSSDEEEEQQNFLEEELIIEPVFLTFYIFWTGSNYYYGRPYHLFKNLRHPLFLLGDIAREKYRLFHYFAWQYRQGTI